MTRKIAFVGTHPSGQGAPFDDPTWEIWGVSARASYFTRATRWYELHRLEGTFKGPGEADNWRAALKKQCAKQEPNVEGSPAVPVHMIFTEPMGDCPVVPYPTDAILDRFGSYFMTSTFGWMIAQAIAEICPPRTFAPEGTEFMVCGIEAEYGTEYKHQRAGLRHFMQLSEHLGVKVRRRIAGGLVHDPIPYPFWQDAPHIAKLEERNAEAKRNVTLKENGVMEAREALSAIIARQVMLRDLLTLDLSEPVRAELTERLKTDGAAYENYNSLLVNVTKEAVYWQAINSEQEYWLDYYMP